MKDERHDLDTPIFLEGSTAYQHISRAINVSGFGVAKRLADEKW